MENKKTKKNQFSLLLNVMEQNPDVARGCKDVSRDSANALWDTIAESLNSLGPPTRTVTQWRKVWTDKKLQIERKLQHNKKEMTAIGGGPNTLHSFNDSEDRIIRLCSLQTTVNKDGHVFEIQSFGVTDPSSSMVAEESTLSDIEPSIKMDESFLVDAFHESGTGRSKSPMSGRQRGTKRPYRETLLENQAEDLSKIERHVSDCARFARKCYELDEKRYELEVKRLRLEVEKYNWEKKMMLEEQKNRNLQLELMKQILEIKRTSSDDSRQAEIAEMKQSSSDDE
ncbi:uncharacterized protein LOC129768980 [Toxorhynchites rutilus septentrionalis]|uniref:uncharacterized protein LOC129768980 n=1 Tax=Toxorhynchites rutilus septentrionalis TaxID=329112 RepID=UPI002479E824|nr:uncharacterized protein LOC129768980 [Toxorhynchites rutilus septentrionalis]